MVIRTRSGRVVELGQVWVGANAKPSRGRRKGNTTAEKQLENQRGAIRRLARILNCNYGHGDFLATLTLSDEGLSELERLAETWGVDLLTAAKRDGGNFVIKRLSAAMKRKGLNLRWVLVTSDMDGETGETVRLHHHLVVPSAAREFIETLWTRGAVDFQPLDHRADHTGLAVYLVKQVRQEANAKKWRTSRNMVIPTVTRRWLGAGEELRPDRGGRLLERNSWDGVGPQYIRFAVDDRRGPGGRLRGRKPPQEFGDVEREESLGAGGARDG